MENSQENTNESSTSNPKKENKFLKFVLSHKMNFFLLSVLLLSSAWLYARIILTERNFAKEKDNLVVQFESKIDSLTTTNMTLTATTFSWAIRSELLRDNKEEINLFFNEFIKNDNIERLQFVNSETGLIELSTDKKDEGTSGKEFLDINEQKILEDSSAIKIATPIAGLNTRKGVFVMTVAKTKK